MGKHHLIVEMLQHTTSPLTSALTIFFTYKASHLPKMAVFMRATSLLLKAFAPTPTLASPPAPATTAHLHAPPHVPPHIPSRPISTAEPPAVVVQAAAGTSASSGSTVAGAAARALHRAAAVPPWKVTALPARFSPLDRRLCPSVATGPPRSMLGTAAAAAATAGPTGAAEVVAASVSAATDGAGAAALVTATATPVSAATAVVTDGLASAAQQAAHASASLLDAVMTTGPVTGHSVPFSVAFFEQLIDSFHAAGLNWGSAIIATTLVFRVLVLPLNVSLVRNTARLYLIRNQIAELRHTMYKGNPGQQVEAAREFFQVLRKGKAHPFKNLVSPLMFPPIFLSLFGAVHGMCTSMPELKTGGALWFTDLTLPDETGVLPVISALSWLATIELASGKAFHMPAWMLSATRLLAVACIPITEPLPAGVFMFWLTSNFFAMGRAAALRIPRVARFFGIPPVNRPNLH